MIVILIEFIINCIIDIVFLITKYQLLRILFKNITALLIATSMATRQNLAYTTFAENEIVYGNIFLILFYIKCQWLVPKFECKVYQNGKNRSIKYLVVSLFLKQFFCFS